MPIATLLLSFMLLGGCARDRTAASEVELTVSVAASLREVAEELATQYMAAHPKVIIRNNIGASGALQQQIMNGAGVDIYLPAATWPMAELAAVGLVDSTAVSGFARNRLVLITPKGSELVNSIDDLAAPSTERIALGTPESVPAGDYAVTALRELGLWGLVKGKAIFGSSVRQVLTYVELGEVDAGIVYATDAATSERIRVVAPLETSLAIEYPAAVLNTSEQPDAARRYMTYLLGQEAGEILARHGFRLPDV